MVLPLKMSDTEKRGRLAVMEAAISASLSHPNIVRTFTYSLIPMRNQNSNPPSQMYSAPQLPTGHYTDPADSSPLSEKPTLSKDGTLGLGRSLSGLQLGAVFAFEVQIILELCDLGTLQSALDAGAFCNSAGPDSVNYLAVLDIAIDIAKGMLHLHSCNIIHSDLKPCNVLLQSASKDPKGCIAKVCDFGLSITKLNSTETHVSGHVQGTLTHMAPEVIVRGTQSNAADVYSFGITLFEVYSGKRAFEGVHQVRM